MSQHPEGRTARLECYAARGKLIGLLLLTCLLVGTSAFCATLPEWEARAAGWIGIAFFSLGFIAIPVQFMRRGPQVILDEEGIEDRRLRLGVIPWEDVQQLRLVSVNRTKFLSVDLVDPDAYLARMPAWKRSLARANVALGYSAITIGFVGLRPGIDEAWRFLRSRPEAVEG